MSAVVIEPGRLSGTLAVPPSKSYAHRAIIAAALARGQSRISNLELSQDIEVTIGAMRALGATITLDQDGNERLMATINGIAGRPSMPLIDCRESGSTLRFLIPVALAIAGEAVFIGSERLGQRSLGPYLDILRSQGIHFEYSENGFPLTVSGELKHGEFHIPGNISSQFISGLMFALPLLTHHSKIIVDGGLESIGYVNITMDVLESFGLTAMDTRAGQRYEIAGGQKYAPRQYAVEGDWSQAAFLLLMGLLGGPVSVGGLNEKSCQGDRTILDIYRDMGGAIEWQEDSLVARQSKLRAVTVDVSQCPDLAPAVAAAMAVAEGESRITGGKRLRDKESDRIAAIAGCLNGLGADVMETEDGMIIRGRERLAGCSVSSRNDHRIAMMAAAVSSACAGPVVLEGAAAVAKSWPGFWGDFKGLGGDIHEQPVG